MLYIRFGLGCILFLSIIWRHACAGQYSSVCVRFNERQLRACFGSDIKTPPNTWLLPKAVQVCILGCIFYLVLCIRVIFLTSNGEDINDPSYGQIGKWVVWWVALGAAQDSCRWDKLSRESHGGNGVRGYCDRHRAQLSHHDERAVAGWRSGPLITLLFPLASNVRKNTQWQVCKRASSKLLSEKINGGARGLCDDLRGQLVTAPRRCWGQQPSESVRGREGGREGSKGKEGEGREEEGNECKTKYIQQKAQEAKEKVDTCSSRFSLIKSDQPITKLIISYHHNGFPNSPVERAKSSLLAS